MRMRITLLRPMRVFRAAENNWILWRGGYRAKGETVERGALVVKIFDMRDFLVIPLTRGNEGQFLLVEEIDERAKTLAQKWRSACGTGLHATDPIQKARGWENAKEIREHLEIYLKAFAPRSHIHLVS